MYRASIKWQILSIHCLLLWAVTKSSFHGAGTSAQSRWGKLPKKQGFQLITLQTPNPTTLCSHKMNPNALFILSLPGGRGEKWNGQHVQTERWDLDKHLDDSIPIHHFFLQSAGDGTKSRCSCLFGRPAQLIRFGAWLRALDTFLCIPTPHPDPGPLHWLCP